MALKFFKKYLKFKKKKNISKFKASIDSVSPSKIIGWCFSENVELSKVKLLIDDEMVISAFIDQERPDVVKAYNVTGKHGFTILMPPNQEVISFDGNYKLLAISKRGDIEFDLTSLVGVKDKIMMGFIF